MTAAAPEVFALVPSYNHAEFVERCLRSIFKQIVAPAKLLVIDDGSTDDSAKIIERTLKDCPFQCEFIRRENRGLSRTLNEGLEKSSGEYFAYLGSDDVWLPQFLENRVRLLNSKSAAVLAYGHVFTIDETENIVDCTADWAKFADGDARKMLLTGLAPYSPTVCYRRASLENARWNENARLEDYEFYLKLARTGEFAFDPKILAAWRVHGSNTSHDWRMMFDEVTKAQNEFAIENNFSQKELTEAKIETRLRYAEIFARAGDRAKALELTRESFGETNSIKPVLRNFARLAAPEFLVRWQQNRRKQKFVRKYGRLEI